MNTVTKILIALIVLHLVVGFGWLVYKLSPLKGDEQDDTETGAPEDRGS